MNIINLLLVMSFSLSLLKKSSFILSETHCTNRRIDKSIMREINPYIHFEKSSFQLPSFDIKCRRKVEIVNNLKTDVDYEKPKRK